MEYFFPQKTLYQPDFWKACEGVMQKCKRGALCRLLAVKAQEMFKGDPWAEDTARSKLLYSSHIQLANAGQRPDKALPTVGKGPSLGHIKNILHSPCMGSCPNPLLSTAQGR